MTRLGLLAAALSLLTSCLVGCGDDGSDPGGDGNDLLAVESLDADYTAERLVAAVTMETLDEERSHVVVQYEWDRRDVDVVLEAFHRDGRLVARGDWTDWNLETGGPIRKEFLDVDWDGDSRTVTFTLTTRLRGATGEVYAYGTTDGPSSPDQVPDHAVRKAVRRG